MFCKIAGIILVMLLMLTGSASSQDDGIKDTIRVNCATLQVGVSSPVTVSLINDYQLSMVGMPLIGSSVDGGFAMIDSIVFVGRMTDPRILDLRIVTTWKSDGVTPDTIVIWGGIGPNYEPMPIGDDAIVELWLTGLSEGQMVYDSGFVPPSVYMWLTQEPTSQHDTYVPAFASCTLNIIDGPLPPVMSIDPTIVRSAVGQPLAAEISACSPDGLPITVDIIDFGPVESNGGTASSQPAISGSGPWSIDWTPGIGDIGLWRVTVQACDDGGRCVEKTMDFQVVTDDSYLVDFIMTVSDEGFDVSSIVHGNLDNDMEPELFPAGSGIFTNIVGDIFDFDGLAWNRANWTSVPPCDLPLHSPRLGYLDDDNLLDCVVMECGGANKFVIVLLGDGTGGWNMHSDDLPGKYIRDAVLAELTGDQYLDYAVASENGIIIYAGNSSSTFSEHSTFDLPGEETSIQSADFDGDGDNDIAAGNVNGIQIWHNDGNGIFSYFESHSLEFGSADIEVTNQGSDFNNDNLYDLCLTSPGIGSGSNLTTFLGNGSGFVPQTICSVDGTVLANCIGDFNGDTELDIAYINNTFAYVAILFGDGDGSFTNEIRIPIPSYLPQRIDCLDADLDGDLDIVVMTQGQGVQYDQFRLFYLENQLDPSGIINKSLQITSIDNAMLEITSPSNAVLNNIKSSIPSGEYRPRNINGNSIVDVQASIGAMESGVYSLAVAPVSSGSKSGTFSVEFDLGNEHFCMARDANMNEDGYTFQIYPEGGCSISPLPGRTIYQNPPVFTWSNNATSYDFQLATDIEFTNIIFSTTVGMTAVTGPELDTAYAANPYFWRVKPSEQPEYDMVNPFSVALVDCNLRGDINHDGSGPDVMDLVYLVTYMFAEGPPPPNMEEADINASGAGPDISDLVYLAMYMFSGGPPLPDCN